MAKRGMPTGPKGGALVVLLVLGAGLAGSSVLDLYAIDSAHYTCEDGIDQVEVQSGMDFGPHPLYADTPSFNCIWYPWSDGSGEKPTPIADQGNNPGGYASSIWEFTYQKYHVENGNDPCGLANFFLSSSPAGGELYANDGTLTEAQDFFNTFCVPPPPPPP
jgi:hypothetical protein